MLNLFLHSLDRHPCNEKPSVVADIGLRLQEGIQELKLEQQLAPTREAITRTLSAGQTNFFKAVEGVKGRWGLRTASLSSASISSFVSRSVPRLLSSASGRFSIPIGMGRPVEANPPAGNPNLRLATVPDPVTSPTTATSRSGGFKTFKLVSQLSPVDNLPEFQTNPNPSHGFNEDVLVSEENVEPAGVAL